MPRKKTDPLSQDYWTSEGTNGKDRPVRVGVWNDPDECKRWTAHQNEVQGQQRWGNGSAGPMRWRPVPIYGVPYDPRFGEEDQTLILPERQWSEPDAG